MICTLFAVASVDILQLLPATSLSDCYFSFGVSNNSLQIQNDILYFINVYQPRI